MYENRLQVCMKCHNLFSGENKNNINLSSAEFAQRVVKVNPVGDIKKKKKKKNNNNKKRDIL